MIHPVLWRVRLLPSRLHRSRRNGAAGASPSKVVLLAALLIGRMVSAAPEEAKQADAFVDSIGINTHYTNAPYKESPYNKPQLDQKLIALGIRHIRDNTESPQGFARIDALGRAGVRAILVPNGTEKPIGDYVVWLKQHVAYEAIEGLNEPDGKPRSFNGMTDVTKGGSPNYPATKAYQEALYKAVKAQSITNHVLVLSPAMAHVERQKYLDGVPFDIGSMHTYPFGGEPKSALGEKIKHMKAMKAPDGQLRPIWITETGYYNRTPNGKQISELGAAKYLPRLLALAFKAGIERTYIYELVDQGNDPNNRELNFGLLRYDLSEKPAYAAIKNLTTLLKEPPSSRKKFTVASLDFEIASSDANAQIEHLLLQKADGRFYLLVWNDVPSWDKEAQKDLTVSPARATIKFAKPINGAKTYYIGPSRMKPETASKTSAIELQILDEVSIVEVTP
jgi:hypothetical protein